MKSEGHVKKSNGSNLPGGIKEVEIREEEFPYPIVSPERVAGIPNALTRIHLARGVRGTFIANFGDPAINVNSRVFISICEYGHDALTTRFIGDARMAVYNIAPYNGGFRCWVEISWDRPLNVRFDVLIDP
jgi:hypothetical protein